MKKYISCLLLLLALVLPGLTVEADAATIVGSGKYGPNLTWELTDDGNLTISGTGEMSGTSVPWESNRDTITSITISEGITSIDFYAFWRCRNLTNVTIPESVTSIWDGAFTSCPNLVSVTIPKNVTRIGENPFDCKVFVDAENPMYSSDDAGVLFNKEKTVLFRAPVSISGSYTLPASVVSIELSAFSDCTMLTSVTLCSNVTTIGSSAFYNCTNLTDITLPASITSIDSGAFGDCVNLTNLHYLGTEDQWANIGLGSDNDILFALKAKLPLVWKSNSITISLHLEDGRMHISGTGDMPNYKYYREVPWSDYASNINTIVIDKGVTSIGDHVFHGCKNITSITIPTTVTSIGRYAFYGCKNITSITIPKSVVSIGNFAFYDCTSLTEVVLPDTVTSINEGLFCACTSLTKVDIPEHVTSIGDMAFSGCKNLHSITIPDGVTSVGWAAFNGCNRLISVAIPASVATIGENAFPCALFVNENNPIYSSDRVGVLYNKDKTNLIRVPQTISGNYTIAPGVTTIREFAFLRCANLTGINIAPGATFIGNDTFSDCENLVSITIPTSITFIGRYVFNNCYNLTDVYYAGTEEQWNAIENHCPEDSDMYHDGLSHSIIHFNSTVALEGTSQPAIPVVTSSVSNADFLQQVENAEENAYIIADYSGEATLPETAFTAIAGTDKTLELFDEGVTWQFSGNDIVNEVKPIDLKVEIMPVEEHPSDAAQEIQTALEDKPAVVMQFPENGTLPGKATIQVKVDQAMQEYLGSNQNLWVYYFNNQTGELELIAKDLVVVDGTYVEFSITHCSNYVLTKSEHKFPFTDVRNGMWYLNPVFWAVNNKITAGVSETSFAPDATCTRGQIVTFLWRACGSPEPTSSSNPFWDVSSSDYFYKAVLWAVEKGITSGMGDGSFAPGAPCTRGQVATFLWRANGQLAANSANGFYDVAPGAYYYDAVLWAVANGITNGVGEGLFAPDAPCTRGQIVTFLYRAMA